jgi:DNA repair protein RecN (Recombination protein N)
MLRRLHVSDLALIEELTLEFGAGLNVVTGETGAGKSLLQRALALAAGHRSGAEVVRAGAPSARIEAVFDLPPGDDALADRLREIGVAVEPGGEIVVRRTIASGSARGQVQVNDRTIALATLAEVGTSLVRLQGQHESLRLAQPETHLAMLDGFGATSELLVRYREVWSELVALIGRLDALERGVAERERRLELARFDLGELAASELSDPGEERRLEQERLRLRSIERLTAAAADALERLHGGEAAALAAVETMARRLGEAADVDPDLAPIAAELEEAAAPLAEAVRRLQAYASALDPDPARLEVVDERLALLARLGRKHGVEDVAGLIARRDALTAEVACCESDAANPEALRDELARAAVRAWAVADELSLLRRADASRLERAMDAELAALGMPGARFRVRFEELPAGPARGPAAALTRDGAGLGPDGADRIEFDLAANPGEGARPLARVASGGELSRIMLALRHVAGGDGVPTLVFDEVDAGIGGAAAEVVGRRLRSLADRAQVVCITHLAQIAAFADLHYAVDKGARGGRTRTRVAVVTGEARVRELARMLGGDPNGAAALEHAAEMLARAGGPERDRPGAKPRERGRAAAAGAGGRGRGP